VRVVSRTYGRGMLARLSMGALVATVAMSSCQGDEGNAPDSSSTSPADSSPSLPADSPNPDFLTQVEELCAPIAQMHEEALDETTGSGMVEALSAATDEEVELKETLEGMDPPDDLETAFDSYVETLGDYTDAHQAMEETTSDSRSTLESVVEGAEAGVALEEAGDEAGLPESCPPPPGVNVHNTLFVARANLECFEIRQDITAAGPLEFTGNPKEVGLILEMGERVSAAIARALTESSTPNISGLPVKELIKANKERFLAVRALGNSFGDNFAEYQKAARRLQAVSEDVDQALLSVGLLECSELFGLLPF
jgi:hypothetical protein